MISDSRSPKTCKECRHSQDDHAYDDAMSDDPDFLDDQGHRKYATHCHGLGIGGCQCSDWDGQGRPTYPVKTCA